MSLFAPIHAQLLGIFSAINEAGPLGKRGEQREELYAGWKKASARCRHRA
jgi:hypothetical protein